MQNNYNFMVKVTTLCAGNCKCCKNRLSELKKIYTYIKLPAYALR